MSTDLKEKHGYEYFADINT